MPILLQPTTPSVTIPRSQSHNFSTASSRLTKLKNIVIKTAYYTAITAATIFCFCVNPNITAFGFFAGIVWSEKTQQTIDKVSLLLKKYRWPIIALVGFLYFLALPAAVAISSAMLSASLGSKAYQWVSPKIKSPSFRGCKA